MFPGGPGIGTVKQGILIFQYENAARCTVLPGHGQIQDSCPVFRLDGIAHQQPGSPTVGGPVETLLFNTHDNGLAGKFVVHTIQRRMNPRTGRIGMGNHEIPVKVIPGNAPIGAFVDTVKLQGGGYPVRIVGVKAQSVDRGPCTG